MAINVDLKENSIKKNNKKDAKTNSSQLKKDNKKNQKSKKDTSLSKKSTVKKTSKKGSNKKSNSKLNKKTQPSLVISKSKMLCHVPADHCFILYDGKKYLSLADLALEMDLMEDHIFYHHVNSQRNDFANWVRDIIEEVELATILHGINSKEETQLQILKYIVNKLK